jgi:hypothetical protein
VDDGVLQGIFFQGFDRYLIPHDDARAGIQHFLHGSPTAIGVEGAETRIIGNHRYASFATQWRDQRNRGKVVEQRIEKILVEQDVICYQNHVGMDHRAKRRQTEYFQRAVPGL